MIVSADGDELNEALGTNPVSSTPKVVNEVGMNDVGTGPTTPTPNPGQSSSYADVIAISQRFANTAYGFFLGKRVAYPVVANYDGLDAMLENGMWFIRNNPLILKKWHPDVNLLKEDVGIVPVWVKLHGVSVTTSSYARAMIKLRADVESKDNIVVAMPKIIEEGFFTCNVRVEYEWKPPRCACYKVLGHVQEECPKNLGAGETMNLKKLSHSWNKKKNVKPTKEVSKSNSFDMLNSVENDVELDGNIEKIDKMEKLIIDGKVTLVDNEGKALKKVDDDSEDESFFEQWKDSYEHDDYKYDLYDDDMYEGREIPENL
ncbi:copia protein [Tanacetum coccineum]